jgi:Na+/H+ antiporter NhaD/arsenite permease-like protein
MTAKSFGLNGHQAVAIAVFSVSVMGTLLFWDLRLGFALIGAVLLLATNTIDVSHFVKATSLEVILFLAGMMVLVGLLKEQGFFSIVSRLLLGIKNVTAHKFVIIMCVMSAVLAGLVDEVTSIIFMIAAILEICDRLKVDPLPYVIMSFLATNIGSAATVLGNPIGIIIATKSGLTFEDFIIKALPIAVICLMATIGICIFWFRKTLKEMDKSIRRFKGEIPIQQKPLSFNRELKISLVIFGVTLLIIALHHRIELLLGLSPSTIMLAMPLLSSSIVFIWKGAKARKYVEKDVEWWTLLFFMFLFAQAGALQYTGVTDEIAKYLTKLTDSSMTILISSVLWISTIGSSVLDNIVLVATFVPVIQSFKGLGTSLQPLWWALLFGGCFGGNITLVGSTANIVALGILEKEKNIRITFMRWLGIGLTVGLITTIIAMIALLMFPMYH